MKKRRYAPYILTLAFLIACLTMPTQASNIVLSIEKQNTTPAILYASGGFSTSVPADTLKAAGTSFPLEIGETIAIEAHYSPSTASVDFGFVAPDGFFYPVRANNVFINVTIEVTQHGYYTLAIRNNSTFAISAFGVVTY